MASDNNLPQRINLARSILGHAHPSLPVKLALMALEGASFAELVATRQWSHHARDTSTNEAPRDRPPTPAGTEYPGDLACDAGGGEGTS